MFYAVVVVFRMVMLLYSEQSLDDSLNDYSNLKSKRKAPQVYCEHCVVLHFCAKMRYVVLNGMTM